MTEDKEGEGAGFGRTPCFVLLAFREISWGEGGSPRMCATTFPHRMFSTLMPSRTGPRLTCNYYFRYTLREFHCLRWGFLPSGDCEFETVEDGRHSLRVLSVVNIYRGQPKADSG
jgi:hypothetical protein